MPLSGWPDRRDFASWENDSIARVNKRLCCSELESTGTVEAWLSYKAPAVALSM